MKHFLLWLYKFVFGRPPIKSGERWVVKLYSDGEREVVVNDKDGKWVQLRNAKDMRKLGWHREIDVVWVRKVELNR